MWCIHLLIDLWLAFLFQYQEPHKLLQPMDKTLQNMATEFAEFQVTLNYLSRTKTMSAKYYHRIRLAIVTNYIFVLIMHLTLTFSGLCWLVHHNSNICRCCFSLCCSKNHRRAGMLLDIWIQNILYLYKSTLSIILYINNIIYKPSIKLIGPHKSQPFCLQYWRLRCASSEVTEMQIFNGYFYLSRCTTIILSRLFLTLLSFLMIFGGMSQGLKDLKQ